MRLGTTLRARAGCTTWEARIKGNQLAYPAKELVYPAINRGLKAQVLIFGSENRLRVILISQNITVYTI